MRWWHFKKRHTDLERELRSDLELEEEEQRENGLPPEEARYAARRAFGNTTLIREQTHEAWGWTPIERLFQDARYALRQLRRTLGFTLVALLIMACGIGASTAVFSILDSVQVFYGRRFHAYSAERVVRELTEFVREQRIDEVALLDSNFPVDVRRAIAIARGIYKSGVRFSWTFQASTDFLSRTTDDEVRMMGASGVRFMGFGAGFASESVLKAMNKMHQRLSEMYETARKSQLAGIRVSFNLIFGYPGETQGDRLLTLRTMNSIARKHPNVSFSPNIFTPYPGIPIWPQLREMKVHEPASLREWATLPLGANTLPWLQGAELRRLRSMLRVFLVNNSIRETHSISNRLGSALRKILSASLEWRLRTSRFAFPWEVLVAGLVNRVVTRRSLITGQPLSGNPQDAC